MKTEQLTQLSGLHLRVDYGEFVYETRYPDNSTFIWKSVKGSSMTGMQEGEEVTEKIKVLVPAPNSFLIGWVEKTGLGVTQLLNLDSLTVHSFIRKENELTTESGTVKVLS